MALYDRLLGVDDAGQPVTGQIPIHQFQACAAEWAKGRITGAQAQSIITAVSGSALTSAEQTEAQTLIDTVPTGGTTANQAARALRMLEIDQVLLLADAGVPGYSTPTEVKAKLGV
jgi:hypothetical protein